MTRRRLDTSEATTVRTAPGMDDALPAGLLPSLDDHAGPARRLASAKSAAMVASIVDAAMRDAPAPTLAEGTGQIDAPGAPAPKLTPTATTRPAPRRLVPVLAAALLVAAVVGAAAAVVTTRYLAPAREAAPRHPHTPTPPKAPAVMDEVPDEIQMDPAEPFTTRAPKSRKPAAPPREREPRALPADAPPEDILALANQRRKERAWRDADDLYRRVVRSFPKSDAAIVAEVASATLHLEHLGDPDGALAGYRRVLRARPGGALGEEARWGIAEAFRARGDIKGETTALRVFLDAHPGSALAPAARRRLAELAP